MSTVNPTSTNTVSTKPILFRPKAPHKITRIFKNKEGEVTRIYKNNDTGLERVHSYVEKISNQRRKVSREALFWHNREHPGQREQMSKEVMALMNLPFFLERKFNISESRSYYLALDWKKDWWNTMNGGDHYCGKSWKDQALEVFKLLQWHKDAAYQVASIELYYKKPLSLTDKEQLRLIEERVKEGDEDAQLTFSTIMLQTKESMQQGLNLLYQLAEKGHSKASVVLYQCSQRGDIILQKPAIEYLKEAVAKRDPVAEYLMAVAYTRGKEVTTDKEKAFSLFLSASRAGNYWAKFNLASCYEYGWGTPMNERAAGRLYETVLESAKFLPHDMYCQAALQISRYLIGGIPPVEQDVTKGIKWLQRGAEADYSYAISELSDLQKKFPEAKAALQSVLKKQAETEKTNKKDLTIDFLCNIFKS